MSRSGIAINWTEDRSDLVELAIDKFLGTPEGILFPRVNPDTNWEVQLLTCLCRYAQTRVGPINNLPWTEFVECTVAFLAPVTTEGIQFTGTIWFVDNGDEIGSVCSPMYAWYGMISCLIIPSQLCQAALATLTKTVAHVHCNIEVCDGNCACIHTHTS